jgi:hypothetical protein
MIEKQCLLRNWGKQLRKSQEANRVDCVPTYEEKT